MICLTSILVYCYRRKRKRNNIKEYLGNSHLKFVMKIHKIYSCFLRDAKAKKYHTFEGRRAKRSHFKV